MIIKVGDIILVTFISPVVYVARVTKNTAYPGWYKVVTIGHGNTYVVRQDQIITANPSPVEIEYYLGLHS